MSRRKIVAGNWKMNLNCAEAVELAKEIAAHDDDQVDIALFPTFPWLVPVAEALRETAIELGAQNCYTVDAGAFTGEVSPAAISEFCQAVLAGHSERRQVIGESNALVGDKVTAILNAQLTAYLCVGETLAEREAGDASTIVFEQLETGLASVTHDHLSGIVIAYEPVWAIGTGVAASPADAQEMCQQIRGWMTDRFGESGSGVRVLYGGSVSPGNVDELFACDDIDGGLVGGASLNADSFGALIQAASRLSAV